MKINWGTGIVIAFVLFISFIMYFVVSSLTDESLEHELVTKDYYKKELNFQKEIDTEKFTKDAGVDVAVTPTAEGLELVFPEDQLPEDIKGKVFLYRPSNKHLDFEVAISLSDPHLLIPKDRLLDGRWNIEIRWTCEGKSYLVKKAINY
ncbi:FixH family protein [Robertkochia sediminum]|uniref:FixH family protein n=1 Tax=Robertkochia sediminum TaxID=2785326 RepID=UPI0019320089|nr:FixH family protein [Robertkochia sediminum]MBL7471292.1 FixH family protein [Robertkochia sediminum]